MHVLAERSNPPAYAGPPEGTAEEELQRLEGAEEVLAAAPVDEVLAELLALQAELACTSAINRSRIVPVLQAVLDDLPAQQAAAEKREQAKEEALAHMTVSLSSLCVSWKGVIIC